jgi:hypothetical protein
MKDVSMKMQTRLSPIASFVSAAQVALSTPPEHATMAFSSAITRLISVVCFSMKRLGLKGVVKWNSLVMLRLSFYLKIFDKNQIIKWHSAFLGGVILF